MTYPTISELEKRIEKTEDILYMLLDNLLNGTEIKAHGLIELLDYFYKLKNGEKK